MKLALVSSGIQTMLSESSKYFYNVGLVLLFVIGVNQDVIQVHDRNVKHVGEDVIHEMLKRCWSIGKSEGHNSPFIRTISGAKGGFPFIVFGDLDQMVSVPEVDLCIDSGLSGCVQKVSREWERVSVLFCDLV